MDATELSAPERRILADIDTYGWHSQHVFDPELARPNFTYTIGFSHSLDAPEFIVFGLHRDVMRDMLAALFQQIKAGRKVERDQRWQGLVEDFDLVAKKADQDGLFTDYAVMADWFWKRQGHDGHPALVQLVWPGWLDGLYPWDEGCAHGVIAAQPQLWA
jgi:hypothetical protein